MREEVVNPCGPAAISERNFSGAGLWLAFIHATTELDLLHAVSAVQSETVVCKVRVKGRSLGRVLSAAIVL